MRFSVQNVDRQSMQREIFLKPRLLSTPHLVPWPGRRGGGGGGGGFLFFVFGWDLGGVPFVWGSGRGGGGAARGGGGGGGGGGGILSVSVSAWP